MPDASDKFLVQFGGLNDEGQPCGLLIRDAQSKKQIAAFRAEWRFDNAEMVAFQAACEQLLSVTKRWGYQMVIATQGSQKLDALLADVKKMGTD